MGNQTWSQGSRVEKALDPWDRPGTRPNPSNFLLSPCPECPGHERCFPLFPRPFPRFFAKVKTSFWELPPRVSPGKGRWGMQGSPPCLTQTITHKDLLTSTFTQVSHDRGIKTWCVQTTYPECLYCDKTYRYERLM